MFKYLNVPTVQGLSRSLPHLGKLYNLNPNTPNTRDEMEIHKMSTAIRLQFTDSLSLSSCDQLFRSKMNKSKVTGWCSAFVVLQNNVTSSAQISFRNDLNNNMSWFSACVCLCSDRSDRLWEPARCVRQMVESWNPISASVHMSVDVPEMCVSGFGCSKHQDSVALCYTWLFLSVNVEHGWEVWKNETKRQLKHIQPTCGPTSLSAITNLCLKVQI